MKNMKFWRTALVAALVLTVMLSVTGGTIAWFTDSVESKSNKIEAGNLDIDLYMYNGTTGQYEEITDKSAPIFGGAASLVAQNNNADTLWEPGKTQVAYLKLVNNGNLALKYNVSLNVLSETNNLSQAMLYAITPNAQNGSVTAWNAANAQAVVTGEQKVSGEVSMGVDAEHYFALSIHMDEEAGNEYQGGTAEFDITVYATQDTVEHDSFDNKYDAGANDADVNFTSLWDGNIPAEMPETLVVDGATQTIHVKDAAAFAYLSTLSEKWADFYTDGNGREYSNYANGAGVAYYYSGQWTVSLEADIDLNNHQINPVSLVIGEATGDSAFKGNNHVIRNINTTTGLFANDSRITYADLNLENVEATNGALTGSSRTSIRNVTVKNATISGTDYVGGLVGYIYGDVIGCKVIDSSVTASGKEAGGLIGFIDSSSGDGKVTNNEVRDVSVSADNRAAGLVAQANVGVKVYNNTINNVTVEASDTSKYPTDPVISNAIVPENVYDNTIVVIK